MNIKKIKENALNTYFYYTGETMGNFLNKFFEHFCVSITFI